MANRARRTRPAAFEARLACGPVVAALESDDRAAAEWLVELVDPWFVVTAAAADVRISVSSAGGAYAAIQRPADATPRPCFALDQRLVSFPSWPAEGGVVFDDEKRACALVVSPSHVTVLGDPSTRRWRFTLQLVVCEIVATLERREALDLHAAAIAYRGRGIAITGAKRAGKTTLSLHLLRSGLCRWIANDRAFAADQRGSLVIRGMPTAVRIQPQTVADFPELRRGLASVERRYLHSVDEVMGGVDGEPSDAPSELALSPAQFARQLHVEPLRSAPLGALVFPEIRPEVDGFAVEKLEPPAVAARLWANLYGRSAGRQQATIFEEIHGGRNAPSRDLAVAMSESAAGFRIVLGRNAYRTPDFAARVLDAVSP